MGQRDFKAGRLVKYFWLILLYLLIAVIALLPVIFPSESYIDATHLMNGGTQ